MYWKYWQKQKWDVEKCVCCFHSEGLSKLEFCSDMGLLRWTFRKLTRKFASPLVLGVVGTPSWAQKMSVKNFVSLAGQGLELRYLPYSKWVLSPLKRWYFLFHCGFLVGLFFSTFLFIKDFSCTLVWNKVCFSVFMFCKVKKKKSIFVSLNIRHIHNCLLSYFFFKSALDSKIEFHEKVVVCVLFKNMENK